jgi:hypothetical protein
MRYAADSYFLVGYSVGAKMGSCYYSQGGKTLTKQSFADMRKTIIANDFPNQYHVPEFHIVSVSFLGTMQPEQFNDAPDHVEPVRGKLL